MCFARPWGLWPPTHIKSSAPGLSPGLSMLSPLSLPPDQPRPVIGATGAALHISLSLFTQVLGMSLPPTPPPAPPQTLRRAWLPREVLPVSDVNPHLRSLPLLVPMATRVRTCLYVCLWERYPVDMRGHMWMYLHLDPLCSVTRARAAALGSVMEGGGREPGRRIWVPCVPEAPPSRPRNHTFITRHPLSDQLPDSGHCPRACDEGGGTSAG